MLPSSGRSSQITVIYTVKTSLCIGALLVEGTEFIRCSLIAAFEECKLGRNVTLVTHLYVIQQHMSMPHYPSLLSPLCLSVDLVTYVTRFQWDMAKYPIKQSLKNISEIIAKVRFNDLNIIFCSPG